jgi:hypothetical protein
VCGLSQTTKIILVVTISFALGVTTGIIILESNRPATTRELYWYWVDHKRGIGESWEDWACDNWNKPISQIESENAWRYD